MSKTPIHPSSLTWAKNKDPASIFRNCSKLHHLYRSNLSEFESKMHDFSLDRKSWMIFASNRIENSKTTFQETNNLLEKCIPLKKDSIKLNYSCSTLSEREVLQHSFAIDYLFSLKEPLTEENIKEAHKILTDGLLDDRSCSILPGEYRSCMVSAGTMVFMDPSLVPDAMEKFIKTLHGYMNDADAYFVSAWVLAQFVTIHPFNDGNGRMSRLLFNYVLQKKGIPFIVPIGITSKETKRYMHLLKRYQRHAGNIETQLNQLYTWVMMLIENSWEEFYQKL